MEPTNLFAIAPTLIDWLERMNEPGLPREVNFWTPTPWGIRRLAEGDRFYFLLKAPYRKVGGFGRFVRYEELTTSEAWAAFGLGNGADSAAHLTEKVSALAEKNSKTFVRSGNPTIGCIVLRDIVIADPERWMSPEQAGYSFPTQVVKLKYFPEPDRLAPLLGLEFPETASFQLVSGKPGRKIASRKDRKGQSAFRDEILANYGHRCAVVRTTVAELLEAAHIQPYVDQRSNHPQNGICLRVDLHRLFDAGLLAISTDGRLQVSKRLAGTTYERLEGKPVSLPTAPALRPSETALAFHRTEIFR